ncbi:MAG: hypothetical protein OEZ38_12795 [Gammaproteobacteria bacterium]|nr:hypothetical protein [Gammaproteobacteria bacterium]
MPIQNLISRPLANKKVDSFYVSFYGMSENYGNILGRQVQSIERPTLNFNRYEVRNKGLKFESSTRIEYQEISISFFDDNSSLVSRALIEQVKRQTAVNAHSTEDTFFQIGVKCYSVDEDIVEEFELKHCYLGSISNSEMIQTDSSNNIITITVIYNDIDYKFPSLEHSFIGDEFGNILVDHEGNYVIG